MIVHVKSGEARHQLVNNSNIISACLITGQREENHMTSIGFGEIQIISPEAFVQNQECTVVVTPRGRLQFLTAMNGRIDGRMDR